VEKMQFVTSEPGSWWLVTPDYYVIEETRKHLGEVLGFGDGPWYLQPERLEDFHRRLEAGHYQLLTDLDAAHDDAKRTEWLRAVAQALKPASGEGSPEPARLRPEQPTTVAQQQTPKRPSAFAKKPKPELEPEPEPESTAAPAEQQQTRPSAFSKKSAFPEKAPKPPARTTTADETAEAALGAAVKAVVADLAGSPELASELGLSEADLQALLNELPADYESRVAAEATRLAGHR
jgi:outer membrane biosynthesis protein TonB